MVDALRVPFAFCSGIVLLPVLLLTVADDLLVPAFCTDEELTADLFSMVPDARLELGELLPEAVIGLVDCETDLLF